MSADPAENDMSVAQADLRQILRALGLFDGARPISPHEVVERVVLPAISALKEERDDLRSRLRTHQPVAE